MLVYFFLPCLLFASGVEDAKTYHNNSKLQWDIAMGTMDLVSWSETERVLDIGCGDGKITALISKKVPKGFVLGIDISQTIVDFALVHYPHSDYPNLDFKKIDATKISFENQFDKVVSFSSFHLIMDQEKALRGIYRALVSGGKLCMHTFGKGFMNVTEIGDELVHTDRWASYFPLYVKQKIFFSEQEYRELFEKIGFKHVQVHGFWNEAHYENRQALLDFAKPILNFIRHLPAALQQEFTEEVVDKIILMTGQKEDGSILYKTYNLHGLAEK